MHKRLQMSHRIFSVIIVLALFLIMLMPGSCSAQPEENLPPVANLYLDPSRHLITGSVQVFDEVFFVGSDSYDPNPGDNLTYLWEFGDNNISNQVSPMHIFHQVGEYIVKLTVSDSNLSDSRTIKIIVYSEGGNSPVAKIVLDSDKDESGSNYANVSEPIIFDASGSFDPDGFQLTYEWDFGDGDGSKLQIVTHEYDKDGVYTAVLTVYDAEELKRSESVTIRIGTGKSSPSDNDQSTTDDNSGLAIIFLVIGVVIVFLLIILWFFIGRLRARTLSQTIPATDQTPGPTGKSTGRPLPDFSKPEVSASDRMSRKARMDRLTSNASKMKQVMMRKKLQDERKKLDDDMKQELKDMGIEL
jgi:PKD repeat protein